MCVVLLRRSDNNKSAVPSALLDQITRRSHQWTGGLLPIVPLGQFKHPFRMPISEGDKQDSPGYHPGWSPRIRTAIPAGDQYSGLYLPPTSYQSPSGKGRIEGAVLPRVKTLGSNIDPLRG